MNNDIDDGESWYEETVLALHSKAKVYQIIGVLSLILASISITGIVLLIPLKTVEPYVIEVDRMTGETKVLKQYSGDIKKVSFNEVLSKYWINRYLIARESYSPKSDIEENYTEVTHLSEGKALAMYTERFKEESTENPFTKYGKSRVRLKVSSISFLRSDTATIRYKLITTTTANETITRWVEIIKFQYINTPKNETDMLANPLGFKVIEYRTDSEIIE